MIMHNAITGTFTISIVSISGTLLIKDGKICHSHKGNDELPISSMFHL
jgi:hypothetical protein